MKKIIALMGALMVPACASWEDPKFAIDSGPADTGMMPVDATPPADAGQDTGTLPVDSGTYDTGTDTGTVVDSGAPCGALHQACCGTAACNASLTCQSGTCQPAPVVDSGVADSGSPDTGTPADSGMPVTDSGSPCGAASQVCCSTGSPCNTGLVCNSLGMCQTPPPPPCGLLGQLCCTSGTICGSGLSCISSTCQPTPPCGGAGETCCGGIGGACGTGTSCDALGICQPTPPPCGAASQVCCSTGSACSSGLVCDSSDTCQVPCGAASEGCCGGIGGGCGAGLSCSSSGICTPFTPCGAVSQICCGGTCNSGLTCSSGICSPMIASEGFINLVDTAAVMGGRPITESAVADEPGMQTWVACVAAAVCRSSACPDFIRGITPGITIDFDGSRRHPGGGLTVATFPSVPVGTFVCLAFRVRTSIQGTGDINAWFPSPGTSATSGRVFLAGYDGVSSSEELTGQVYMASVTGTIQTPVTVVPAMGDPRCIDLNQGATAHPVSRFNGCDGGYCTSAARLTAGDACY